MTTSFHFKRVPLSKNLSASFQDVLPTREYQLFTKLVFQKSTQHWSVKRIKTRLDKRKFHDMIAQTVDIIKNHVTFLQSITQTFPQNILMLVLRPEKEWIVPNQITRVNKHH